MLSRLRCNGNLYAFDTHDLVRVLQNDELQQFNRGNNAMVSGIFIAAITPVMMITLEYDVFIAVQTQRHFDIKS